MPLNESSTLQSGISKVADFRNELGPFVHAAETTHMPMIFTDARVAGNPVVFVNDAFLTLTGFTRKAVTGTPLCVLLGKISDNAGILAIEAELARGGTGTWELPCRRADKSDFIAAVFLSPVREAGGKVQQNFLSFVELGGHVERLVDQRNELHALYELAPGFIATSEGPSHRFTFANASYRRFVRREDLIGLTVPEALPEIAEQGFVEILDQVYATGEPYFGHFVPMELVDPTTQASELRYCNFVYEAVRNARGEIRGLFCEGYDVTQERLNADALAQLQSEQIHVTRVNAMGTMAATLAHELNQPLSAIANYTTGARRLLDPDARNSGLVTEALEGIDEATIRAADIIGNLRELTKRRERDRAPFDLHAAVDECLRLVRAAAAPGCVIKNEIPSGLTMAADRIQIQQVVINLLRNACDAIVDCRRQEVSISAQTGDDGVTVAVTDSGSGVPTEIAMTLFSWSESTKKNGMGLGLSISQTIMEAHRGKIWLDRSGPDGSRFCFTVGKAASPADAKG